MVRTTDFDADPELLNCRNGYVNLRSGVFTPHTEPYGKLFRMVTTCAYDPTATCPRFLRYLEEAHRGDRDRAASDQITPYLQYIAGTAAIGRPPPHRAGFWIFGPTATGKSVFANTLMAILGTYAAVVHVSLLMRSGYVSRMAGSLARLPGKRLACINEVPDGQIDDTIFKSLTSSDRESVRELYRNDETVRFTHTLLATTNHQPIINDVGGAVFARLRPIPFANRVEKPDDGLERALQEEASGILNWIIEGARRVLNEPDLYRVPPAAVREGIDRYRDDMDVIGQFIADCCEKVLDINVVNTADLFTVFRLWASKNNQWAKITFRRFRAMLQEAGYPTDRHGSGSAGTRLRGVVGLAINEEYEKLFRRQELRGPNTHTEVHPGPA